MRFVLYCLGLFIIPCSLVFSCYVMNVRVYTTVVRYCLFYAMSCLWSRSRFACISRLIMSNPLSRWI